MTDVSKMDLSYIHRAYYAFMEHCGISECSKNCAADGCRVNSGFLKTHQIYGHLKVF